MARGGKRKGAGRPKGTGKFGEPTKAVRLPVSKIDQIMAFIERNADMYPIYSSDSPIQQNPMKKSALTGALVTNPEATFQVRITDDSMKAADIFDGDLLIADKILGPKHGDIVITALNGKLIVRRLVVKNEKLELKTGNPKFPTIKITEEDEIDIWGVVTRIMHPVRDNTG